MAERVPVWDAPIRLFHWALAGLVVFSFATGKLGGGWMGWHVKSGYCILALLLFRLAWGVAGSDTARFTSFLRGPTEAFAYARSLFARRPAPYFGHNPLGGWMTLAMLALLLLQAGSGLFADDEISTQGPLAVKVSNAVVARMSWVHEVNQWMVVGVVTLHVIAIATYQWGLKVNLIGRMFHGSATAMPVEAPRQAPAARAAILLAIAAAGVYWLVAIYPKQP